MNEEPPTPLYPGFMEWHAKRYPEVPFRQHYFTVGSCDVYLYRRQGGDWSVLLCWGNEWMHRDCGEWLGASSWNTYLNHPRLRHVPNKEPLHPAMECGLRLLSLHQ